ncbi:unnamed protein product [Peniophora sp. CBMAI 1063]|nr:unnamed protein product [Peniophora sp. CBMAI 1063]
MRTQDARVSLSASHHGLHKDEPAVAWSVLLQAVKGMLAPQAGAKAKSKRGAGKKRARDPGDDGPAAKKRKADDGSAVSDDRQPVFRLSYELGYKLRPDEDAPPEARELCDILYEHGDTAIQLPDLAVQPRPKGARLRTREGDAYLMFLPPPSQGEDHLFAWLSSINDFNPGPAFADLTASARLVLPADADMSDERTIPFQIQVDLTLHFITPHIFHDKTDIKTKAKRVAFLSARSELLQLAFPPAPLPPSLSAAYIGRTDIPFFYATVQPAPELSDTAMQTVQPDELNPTLLPFQRRSVAWLLAREGKAITPDGTIVPASFLPPSNLDDDLPLLWTRVSPTEDIAWYYERLTDTISPDYPVQEPPLPGAILAEEPGLGKTLECISLMLLNPGVGRDPDMSRWDAQAGLDVKEVKTTLIVTPASLLRQWVDEIELHAPSLKVFVYEGWSKLPINVKHNGLRSTSTASSSKDKGKSKASPDDAMDVDFDSPAPSSSNRNNVDAWAQFINSYDVCITTYNVLQQDLHVARAPPRRPRRETAEYSTPAYLRPRSPLVCVEFWRVIMDEVQMVGGGRSLEMVSLIPRHSSLAVSGTPAKTSLPDLSHVLRYLRTPSLFHSKQTWDRLLRPEMVGEFVRLMRFYTCRTVKRDVKDELTIPVQTRWLVGVELGRVERHVYDQELGKCLQELGLDARGVAATENWEIDTALLRSWLRKLRMICTHPQVGTLQNTTKNQKTGGANVLKSMEEVLDGMRELNWQNLMTDRRQKVEEMARSAQLIQHNPKLHQRHAKALDTLTKAEAEAQALIDDLQSALDEHAKLGEILKEEYAQQQRERELLAAQNRDASNNNAASEKDKGKGKARALSPESDEDSMQRDEDDDENDGLPKTPKVKSFRDKRSKLKKRMRDALITLHKAKFLQGDVHHVLGKSHQAEEDKAYQEADGLRKKILKLSEEGARAAMAELSKDYVAHSTTRNTRKKEFFVQVPLPLKGGVKTADLIEQANEILQDGLNAQTTLLWTWRTHLYKLLTESLNATSSDSETADGEEYSRSLNTQGEADVYVQAYKALLADRREILVAERTALAEHEGKEKKKRKTKTAAAAAAAKAAEEEIRLAETELEMADGEKEVLPEHEVLFKELMGKRKEIMDKFDGKAVKSIVVQTANVAVKIAGKSDMEKILATEITQALRQIINTQSALNEKLEADLVRFRKAFNERVQYYKQLQSISDSLKEAEWQGGVDEAIEASDALQAELDGKIKTGRARERYLQHLTEEGDDEEDGCILCRCDFNRGYLTECAHSFCEDCMKGWLSRSNKVCPVCRVPIDVSSLQRFTVKPTTATTKPSNPPSKLLPNGEDALPRSRRKIEYNSIPRDVLDEIDSFEVGGSYGSKIESLVRHLLYLRITDPGAKSIVFSAFEDSLHIVEHALRTNDIPCLRIESTAGTGKARTPAAVRFKQDPELLVLLLHGERENAGLNVTCASRVFLLESVVHHSFEVQAIARIDRMGQTRPTEVFCYYAEETVEKNILDLAARKGLSLYTTEKSQGTLDVAPAAIAPDAATNKVDAPSKKKDQKGDFIFKLEDMMSILFPHLTEDLEYLLPASEEEEEEEAATSVAAARRERVQANAVAGPSRLR